MYPLNDYKYHETTREVVDYDTLEKSHITTTTLRNRINYTSKFESVFFQTISEQNFFARV